jgi:hypothetical protein
VTVGFRAVNGCDLAFSRLIGCINSSRNYDRINERFLFVLGFCFKTSEHKT